MTALDDLRAAGYDAGVATEETTDEDGATLATVYVVSGGEPNDDPTLATNFVTYLPEDEVRGFLAAVAE